MLTCCWLSRSAMTWSKSPARRRRHWSNQRELAGRHRQEQPESVAYSSWKGPFEKVCTSHRPGKERGASLPTSVTPGSTALTWSQVVTAMTVVDHPLCRVHSDQEAKGGPEVLLQIDVIGQVSGPTSPARAPNRPEQSHTADELKDMGKWGHHSLQVMRMTNPETYMTAHQAPPCTWSPTQSEPSFQELRTTARQSVHQDAGLLGQKRTRKPDP